MEEKKRGRPAKIEKSEIEKKELYRVRDSFFYKGAQFHKGQPIGFSEELFRIGKIELIIEEEEF